MLSSRSLITLKSRWSPQLIYVHFYPQTGLVLIVGTFVKLRTIQYLRHTRRSTSTTIQVDDLVLFEQLVNSINGPIIFIQLVHILFPSYTRELLGNIVFCSIWSALMAIGTFHRAIEGFGIAAVRQVITLHVPTKLWSYFLIHLFLPKQGSLHQISYDCHWHWGKKIGQLRLWHHFMSNFNICCRFYNRNGFTGSRNYFVFLQRSGGTDTNCGNHLFVRCNFYKSCHCILYPLQHIRVSMLWDHISWNAPAPQKTH